MAGSTKPSSQIANASGAAPRNEHSTDNAPRKWLARFRWDLIRFSPFDVRLVLRVLLFLMSWKLLSSDYSALPELTRGPDINPIFPLWMNPWVDSIQQTLFDQTWKVITLQIVAAASMLLGAWRLNRWLLAPGVAILWALQLSAAHFRFISFDYEPPLSLVVIALFWPWPWKKIFRGGTNITPAATTLGTSWAVYIAIMYHMTGLSKIYFDPFWSQTVRLDMLIPAMEVWHGTLLPDWLMSTASFQRMLFTTIGPLSTIIAMMTLLLETFWPLAIISRWCRRVIPFSMFCAHMVIFFGSGILFLAMAVTGISVVTPWRYLAAPMTLVFDAASPVARAMVAIVRRFNWWGRLTIVAADQTTLPEGIDPRDVRHHVFMAVDAYGHYAGITAMARAALRCGPLAIVGTVLLLPVVRWIARGMFRLVIGLFRSREASRQREPRREKRWALSFDRPDLKPLRQSPLQTLGYLGAVLLAAYLGCFPSLLNTYFYPFINYRVFGWSYATAAEPMTVYRLGYFDRRTNEIKFVPMNHGGFMDFNMVSCPGAEIQKYLDAKTDEERAYYGRRLQQYQKALRPYRSNRWLLGPLAHPNHVIAKSEPVPVEWFEELYLLEGHSQYVDGQVHIDWLVRGELPAIDDRRTRTDHIAEKAEATSTK